ncbi:MarR family transcriptional regulator [Olsenella sp. YH-ols2217]|uniref:MarR family transcriptional regulator n=1 Tax=Kribbibacterium absianum TaxID=3044210 RepID=A0ABT6ZJX2_9ACTN|nr:MULTISPECIES: MarR family transcriptional regulator [unclassified Olsenella]MDJ1122396.1 MarR family transcriptional regulator [Olsenella sp. YH-ols2216]MDJ1129350.1 MarR family transcriptional regulator [Olsenella sp. YH-ols2217]
METQETIAQKLMTVQRLMGGVRRGKRRRRDAHRGQGRILTFLKLKDGVSTRDLAEVLGIRVSSLNEVLGRMERDGLIERRQSPDDGRVMLVYLTDRGRAQEAPRPFDEALFAGFSDEELQTLGALLDRLILNLEAQLTDEEREALKERAEARERLFGPDDDFGPEGSRPPHCRHGHGLMPEPPVPPCGHHHHSPAARAARRAEVVDAVREASACGLRYAEFVEEDIVEDDE